MQGSGPESRHPTVCQVSCILPMLEHWTPLTRNRYEHTKLVEVHSHSLFSKYFSESGKLVGKLFSQINEMVHSASTFVVVMIGMCTP